MSLIKLWDVLTKKENPPRCVDCRYSYEGGVMRFLYCNNPKVDPIGGPSSGTNCEIARKYYCKPRGRYFESQESHEIYLERRDDKS